MSITFITSTVISTIIGYILLTLGIAIHELAHARHLEKYGVFSTVTVGLGPVLCQGIGITLRLFPVDGMCDHSICNSEYNHMSKRQKRMNVIVANSCSALVGAVYIVVACLIRATYRNMPSLTFALLPPSIAFLITGVIVLLSVVANFTPLSIDGLQFWQLPTTNRRNDYDSNL